MPRTKLPDGSVPVTFRLPQQVRNILTVKARREESGFSDDPSRIATEIKSARSVNAGK